MILLKHFKLLLSIHSLLISQVISTPEPAPAVPSISNLTNTVLENRIVQNIVGAASNLAAPAAAAKPAPSAATQQKMTAAGPATIKDMLKMLEAQNAKSGDSCDTATWTQHVKPIYDALYAGNKREQDMKNDAFALAILKDQNIISKVCLSAAHFMECLNGKCQCLTKLPANLKYALDKCQNATLGQRSEDGGGGGIAGTLNVVLGFLQNLFAFNSAGPRTTFGQIELIGLCVTGSVLHFVLLKK